MSGNDTLTNNGKIVVTSVAAAPSLAVSVAVTGVATSLSTAEANALAVGIDGGAGDDIINNVFNEDISDENDDNTPEIVSTAVASADAISVSVTGAGVTISGDSIWDGGTTATSEAIGISGDGKGQDLYATGNIEVADGDVRIGGEASSTVVSGNDVIYNEGAVTATSVASALSAGVSVSVEGVAVAASTATAESRSAAIDAGSGNDTIYNSGELVSTSVANANAGSVTVAGAGLTVAAPATFDGGTTAISEAIGISGDGNGQDLYASGNIEVVDDEVRIDTQLSSTAVSGDDTITNDGKVVATSVSFTPSVGVAVTVGGVAGAISTSTAEAEAIAIDAGAGNDTVTNSGELVSTAVANADAVSVAVTPAGVALAAGGFWDGGTTAKSDAIGISGDGEGTDWNAEGNIEVTDEIIGFGTRLSKTEAGGNDTITNTGAITTTSVAAALSVDVSVAVVGVAGAVTAATAESSATAIDAGTGDDFVDNDGTLVSTSVATAITVPVTVAPGGVAIASNAFWDGGSTAISEAVGISGDGEGSDSVASGSVEITEDGVLHDIELTTKMVSGDDTIDNSGDITVTSVSEVPSVSVGVAVIGASAAVSSATAESRAVSIDGGAGNDLVTNTGELVATSVANANSVNVSVTPGGVAIAGNGVWDGGTTAISEAVGISGDGEGRDYWIDDTIEVVDEDVLLGALLASETVSGNDTIINDGKIVATSVAAAPSVGVAVSVIGASAAVSTATAESRAAAIDAGAGNDAVSNSGELVVTSVANADVVDVAVGLLGGAVASDAFWDGGTTAISEAVGISGDGKSRNEYIEGTIETTEEFTLLSTSLSSEAAIGDDIIINDGKITATSVAVAPSINVAVNLIGVAGSVSAAKAESTAVAIDTGAGNDTVTNSGELVATSVANADAIAVSVALIGGAGAANGFFDGGVTATSHAAGITGDGLGQNKTIEGIIEVENVDDVRLSALISSEAASGNDTISNDGKITATSVAVAPAITESISLIGVTASVSTATAEATAVAIDAGAGNDTVTNSGELKATSVATAFAHNVSGALIGGAIAADMVWDGGTTATAKTVGISGDGMNPDETTLSTIEVVDGDVLLGTIVSKEAAGGNDSITNDGKVTATSVVVAPSISEAISGIGVAVAMSTATAESTAIAIDAGAGEDEVINNGELVVTSVANADAISLSLNLIGAAVAADAVWDGGTTAKAEAVGISGDGVGSNETTEAIVEYADDTVMLGLISETEAVSGNDTITNTNTITATSVAVAPSISVAANVIGISAAMSTSTAEARSAAIDAGDGDDTINNSGDLKAVSVANADAVSVSASLIGVSGAGTAAWDGGTTAKAEAVGINGDSLAHEKTERVIFIDGEDIILAEETVRESTGGNDTITNSGDIEATAVAVSVSANVALTGAGAAAAVSTSTALSRGAGIDAGAGDDTVTNSGELTVDSDAVAVAVSGTIAPVGVAVASGAVWDGGTKAKSEAVGISGDGLGEKETSIRGVLVVDGDVTIEDEITESLAVGGNDTIINEDSITALSTAVTVEVGVAATVVGVSAAMSTATAESHAASIDAGAGDDTVNNSGTLIAGSSSTAVAVGVSVTGVGVAGSSDAVWEGGTTALSSAIGIDGGEGADQITNEAAIYASSKAEAVSAQVAADIFGVAAALSAATADADATAIFGGDGSNDTITNHAYLSSIADADATGVSVAVNLAGYAATDTSTTASAEATGIDGGSGDDVIANYGYLYSKSTADAAAAEIDVTIVGAASSDTFLDGETNAESFAAGIEGGDGSDEMTNYNVIQLTSEATTTADSVSVSIVGYSKAEVATTASAGAVGMDGGAGNDYMINYGLIGRIDDDPIEGKVTSDAKASVVPVTLAGAAYANLSNNASTNATGMAGGEGDDTMGNFYKIYMYTKAETPAAAVGVTLAGDLSAKASTTVDADATGMAGGEGNDAVENYHTVIVDSYAEGKVTSVVVDLAGSGGADASTDITASATSLDGGEGNDSIYNDGTVDVLADAYGNGSAVTVELIGSSEADAALNVTAEAVGIDGGSGDDVITNKNTITVDSYSDAYASSVVVDIAGYVQGNAGTTVEAKATGIAGGDGDDEIYNEGTLDIMADAYGNASGVTVDLAGKADADAITDVMSYAIGIAGGSGDNTITNKATVTVDSYSDAYAGSVVVELAGKADGNAGTTAEAKAAGITSGNNNDIISNSGTLDVMAGAYGKASSVTVDLVGSGRAYAATEVKASAVGINSGGGNDSIYNTGSIFVGRFDKDNPTENSINATMDATNTVVNIIGKAEGQTGGDVEATATGINSGSGNDYVENSNRVDSYATTAITLSGSKFDFAGSASESSTMTSNTTATGIYGDSGNDTIISSTSGDINVDATSTLSSSSSSIAIAGKSGSQTESGAVSSAVGISSGYDNDSIYLQGTMDVNATSTATMNGSTFDFAGVSDTGGRFAAESKTIGIDAGYGGDFIRNEGLINAGASASMTISGKSSCGLGAALSSSASGALVNVKGLVGWGGNDRIENLSIININSSSFLSQSASNFTAIGGSGNGGEIDSTNNSYGITGDSGNDILINEENGSINLNASTSMSSSIKVDVGLGYSGTGSIGSADLYAAGISGGSNSDDIRNSGLIQLYASSYMNSYSSAFSGIGYAKSSVSAYGTATADGINGGSGNDIIQNDGTISLNVTSDVSGESKANSIVGASRAVMKTYATSTARGIYDYSGNNYIINEGLIDVNVTAKSNATTQAFAIGVPTTYKKAYANAYGYGIKTGSGNDMITNDGTINVRANADSNTGNRLITAVGISSGAGDDVIINNAIITTSEKIYINGSLISSEKGDGIDSGAGSDTVILSAGSSIACDVILGTGKDTILFEGDAYVSGLTTGDGGTDTLILDNVGSFTNQQEGFEKIVSYGDNSISSNAMDDFNHLEVNTGVLGIDGDYEFDQNDTFSATLNGDGSVGTLQVDGGAILNGKLNVKKGDGAFFDDTLFSVLTSEDLTGNFEEISLPNSAILKFQTQKADKGLDVKVDVASFTTVADTSSEESIGEYLDRLSPTSSGELNDIIAEYQGLSRSQFDQAFASVSPEQYSTSAKAYMNTTMKSFDAIQGRLNTLRKSAAYAPMVNRMNIVGTDAELAGISQKPVGFWNDGFAMTYYEEEPGIVKPLLDNNNFSSLGFDSVIGNNLVVGFGQDYSKVTTTAAFTDGDNTASGEKQFAYGSYMLDDYYMDAAFFYGNESYDHQRDITIGIYEGTAASDHESESFSSYVETGKLLTSGSTIFQPFASLKYIYFREDGFTESGGGPVALKIEDMERDLLISNLGIRVAKMWAVDSWTVMPEISLAWRYNIEPADYSTTASFVSAPGEYFVIDGKEDATHALAIGASLDIANYGKFRSILDFSGELFTDEDRYEVAWTLEYNW